MNENIEERIKIVKQKIEKEKNNRGKENAV